MCSTRLEDDEQTPLHEGVADGRHALSVQHEHVVMLRHLHERTAYSSDLVTGLTTKHAKRNPAHGSQKREAEFVMPLSWIYVVSRQSMEQKQKTTQTQPKATRTNQSYDTAESRA